MIFHTSMESEGSSVDPGGCLSPLSLLPPCLLSFSENIITVFISILNKKQAAACRDESALNPKIDIITF